MSEKPEESAEGGNETVARIESPQEDHEARQSGEASARASSRPPPRPSSSVPPPDASSAVPSNPAPSGPPRPLSSRPPAAPPRPSMKSSPEGLDSSRAPSFPMKVISEPPQAIIDTERQTPVPEEPAPVGSEIPPAPPVPQVDVPDLVQPELHSSTPEDEDDALDVDVTMDDASLGPPVEEEVAIVNPIRAMRVIRIEETKKRHPSAPVLETTEASYADIKDGLSEEQRQALEPPLVPDDAEPISEVEPMIDPPETEEPEVDVEPLEAPQPPPAPSAAPALPRRDSQPDIPPADRKPPPPRRSARPSLPKVKRPRKKAWWETIFGDDFSRAYRPMSQSQLSREVDFILSGLNIPKGSVILDLACGQGEICVELARRGYSVVGYDLSVFQLAMAGDHAQQARQKINFLQGDMREMAFDEMFDAIICWDTSFGYFEDDKNLEVLQRIKKALKPGGRFLLDIMNRDFAAAQAPYNHWFEGDGCVCMDDMSLDWITNRLRVKRSIILDDGRSKEVQYSTRLYTLSEVGRMLHDSGFRVTAVSGDIFTKGAFFGPNSRRIIIQSNKP